MCFVKLIIIGFLPVISSLDGRRFIMRVGVLLFLALVATVGVPVFAYDWTTNLGDGSVDSPYKISTPDELISIGLDPLLLDKHFVLVNDIVFDPDNNPAHVFTDSLIAMSPENDIAPAFRGHFDGAGYRIINMKIVSTDYNTGLFGRIHGADANQVVVRDLTFVNPVVSGPRRVGPLVATIEECTIENCHTIEGAIGLSDSSWAGGLIGVGFYMVLTDCSASAELSGDVYVGGLLGSINSSTIIDCSASGDVTGNRYIGGLAGNNRQWFKPELNDREEIINCHATGNVSCLDESGGGLIGNVHSGLIQNCSATGSITGGSKLGGLIGYIEPERMNYNPPLSGPTKIKSCFATGNVQGIGNYIGGLIGYNQAILVSDCYALGDVSSEEGSYVGGLMGLNTGTVSRSFSAGAVVGANSTGGLVGHNYSYPIYFSYWDQDSSGISVSDEGIGKLHTEMMDRQTFRGWGDDVWVLDDGNDYPHLAWEGTNGQAIVDTRTYSGNGTPDDPYRIATAEDLITVGFYAQDWDKHFILTDDIVLDPSNLNDSNVFYDNSNFNKIGLLNLPFSGHFDGAFHSITGLRNTNPGESCKGLFGTVQGDGPSDVVIENLRIIDTELSGLIIIGGLAGRIFDCKISRCGISDIILSIEGSVGYNSRDFGGVAGSANNSTISQCYVTGCQLNINESGFSYGGGLIGDIYSCRVENSYAICSFDLNSSNWVGGLVGYSMASSIYYCYTVPTSIGYFSIAGIDGNSSSYPQYCWSRSSTTGWYKHSNWDYVGREGDGDNDIWRMCIDGVSRPYLSWEFARTGDFACDDGIGLPDLAVLAENWLTNEAVTPATFSFACDSNGDGKIDLTDLSILSENW